MHRRSWSRRAEERTGSILVPIVVFILIIAIIPVIFTVMNNTFQNLPGAINQNEQSASYIIFKTDVGLTAAKNCSSGRIDDVSSNSSRAIQYALDHANGLIYVKSGSYEDLALNISRSSTSIQGEGWSGLYPYSTDGTVFRGINGTTPIINIYSSTLVDTARISNINFDGTRIPGSYIGTDCRAIAINNSARITISNCIFYGFTKEAIYSYGIYGLTIEDCIISSCGSSTTMGDSSNIAAIRITGGGYPDVMTAVQISNTEVVYSKYIGIWSDDVWDQEDITNCYFDGGMLGAQAYPTYAQVKSNGVCDVLNSMFYNSGGYLIDLGGQNGKIINNLLMLDNGTRGIYCNGASNALIQSNRMICNGNVTFGIMLAGSRNIIVQGNMLANFGDSGIYCPFSSNLTISDNIIKDCGRTAPYSVWGAGISFWHTNYTTVTSNTCYDDQTVKTQQFGFMLNDAVSDYNMITGNNFANNVHNSYIGFINNTHNIVRENVGIANEAYGLVNVTGAVTTLSFAHSLYHYPSLILVTPLQTGQGNYSVSSNNTAIVITFANAPGSSTWRFYWYARI